MDVDKILPSNIEIKYNYLDIDKTFISTIAILDFDLNIEMIKTMNKLLSHDDITISMHYERKNNSDFLKELTNIISKSTSEIKSVSKNQMDINVLDDVKQKAISLRKKIQVDNEQIYLLNVYITVKGKDSIDVLSKTRNIINALYSNRIIAKPCNFKQKEGYIASLPILQNSNKLSKYTNCIFTERGIAKLFPFYTQNVFDDNGTLLGFSNNNFCAIDMFSKKNNNYNMCIFGTSGTGKSYFVKLMLIRNRYKNLKQIIIDPEGEYEEIVKSLGGRVIKLDSFNPFYIIENFAKNNKDFFKQKIENVTNILCHMYDFKDKNIVKQIVEKTYKNFGINSNINSLYKSKDNEKIYIKPKYTSNFPQVDDFLKLLMVKQEDVKKTRKINIKKNNNIKWNEDLYCFSLKGKTAQELDYLIKSYLPFIYEILSDNCLIYLDEIWKLIVSSRDNYMVENIYNMFKTLRKKKAGITIISQDITDLFNVDNGNFGKSILNNSHLKILFKTEWADVEVFEKLRISANKLDEIKSLERGSCYVELGSTNFKLEVKASEYEHNLIEGGKNEENFSWNE